MPIYTNLSFWVYFCCSILSNILIDIALYLCNLTDQQSSKRKHICNIFYCNTEQKFIYVYISIVCCSTIKLCRLSFLYDTINNLKHLVSSPSDWYRNHLHGKKAKSMLSILILHYIPAVCPGKYLGTSQQVVLYSSNCLLSLQQYEYNKFILRHILKIKCNVKLSLRHNIQIRYGVVTRLILMINDESIISSVELQNAWKSTH